MRYRTLLNILIIVSILVVRSLIAQSTLITRKHYYNVNGIKLFCESIGDGSPVIVIHGGPGLDHTYLLPQMLELAKHYKLIFYDQRGSGKSTGKIDSNSITIANFVSDLEGLRKALHLDRINILAHSWGTLLAMHYAIAYPNKVKKMILVSSMGATSNFLAAFAHNREIRRTRKDSIALVRIALSKGFAKRAPPVMENYARIFFRSYFHNQSLAQNLNITFNSETAKNLLPILILLSKQFASYNLTYQLRKIKFPVLIIHGDDDPIPLKYAEELHSIIKGSELVVMKNCGHFPFIENTGQFTRACETFLK